MSEPDPERTEDDQARVETIRFIARRTVIWFAPLLAIGILLVALGLPVWIVVIALVVALAIAVFELNSELFPQNFNVWDSLGEGHKAAGHRDKAIELYRKSLELNPGNANATKMLQELGAE